MTSPVTTQDSEVTLGDPNVEISQFDRYKGSAGKTDRVAIVSMKLIRGLRYYYNKKAFRAPIDSALLALTKAKAGEPEQRFAMVVFHYVTDDKGALVDEAKCQGRIKIWSISETRYTELSNLHAQWPILDAGIGTPQHDVLLTCTEEKFQRMTMTPCPTAHWKTKKAWYDQLKAKEALALVKARLSLGKVLTKDELMEALGSGDGAVAPTGGVQNAGDVDLRDVLDEEPAG